ncbi:MAG: hypothetical protein GX774_06880 [Armatimonadetes bacterium]|nr:hypothetical protein [Armatimonadota bacterium]
MDLSLLLVAAALVAVVALPADAVAPTAAEKDWARRWVETAFGRPEAPPLSFLYDGQPSGELLARWQFSQAEERLDRNRTQRTLTWRDPGTGLEVRCVLVSYQDFPTVEWTVYLKNTGAADTPILEQIQALDLHLERGEAGEFLLRHGVGSPCRRDDYAPLQTPLGPEATKRITAAGGRPTNSDLCYFNLEWGGEGVLLAIGWPGQWAATFAREGERGLRLRVGQELTHFRLHPGEEVRTPLVALQFWQGGDWIRAQNVWRRWMIAHNLPRPGGKLPPPQFVASSSRQYGEMIHANEENQRMFIDRYLEEKLPLDYWWMDAGWYVNETGWPNVGTWEVDRKRFPRGLRAVSDYAHAKGLKTVVWFEPERVTAGTWLATEHPEWVLGGTLLNLGHPEAWQWLTNHVDHLITEEGIDTYRQDFNMDPLPFWRANDAEDRQGITEIRHVTGLLAYWDELRRRHPNLLIDTCASGGRRNDLETLRRAVPLWRTDYAYEPVGTQCHTYGISFWIPYSGTGTCFARSAAYYGEGKLDVDAYGFFSNAAPSLGSGLDMRVRETDYRKVRRLVEQWREYLAPHYYGDYYPLTPYSQDESVWLAWQFDGPEQGTGVVQAFRRAESPYESARLRLRGLSPRTEYTLTDLTTGKTRTERGHVLMEQGLLVTLPERPAAGVIAYRRQ